MNHKTIGSQPLWFFKGREKGDFICPIPRKALKSYFPLFNFAGLMSCVTPELKGDIKTGQNSFLSHPLVSEDIPHTSYSRNFWIKTDRSIWSATGCGWDTCDNETKKSEHARIKAGILYFSLSRVNKKLGLEVESTVFVPFIDETFEISVFTVKNISKKKPVSLTPFYALPIFGRSADNLRDHRQVTTLLNRFISSKYGVLMKPTMAFDERGHHVNDLIYSVTGSTGAGEPPVSIKCLMEDYRGHGGNLCRPSWVFNQQPDFSDETQIDGKEAVAAFQFSPATLQPGETADFIILAGIAHSSSQAEKWIKTYGRSEKARSLLDETRDRWKDLLNRIEFETGDSLFDNWIKWVSLQPFARKVYGCSFLPDFGYGRGGRGWRDLWQDCLSLLLTYPEETKKVLINNFAGVRTDGSNATIIGDKPGEFIADRNNISRTFMDHGVWPLKTTSLYIEQTGDIAILLEKAPYFRDHQIFRGKKINRSWNESSGCRLKTRKGRTYRGTLLEHILVQHITGVFNVGKHNMCRLENADWNDGLDMASDLGESVPFTSFYAGNLIALSRYCKLLDQEGTHAVSVFKEFAGLLKKCELYSRMSGKQKNEALLSYMKKSYDRISGETRSFKTSYLSRLLESIGHSLHKKINQQEWIQVDKNAGFYNGYYDNNGKKADGFLKNKGLSMTLTGQVFPILCSTASYEKVPAVFSAIKKYLQDPVLCGIHLNTRFDGLRMNLGRAYGFAYGTKENGAFFSHMNVMLTNSLYSRGFVRYGHEILSSLFHMSVDSSKSFIFPGLPEYFDFSGRGAYHYLTGSASWMILTMLTQVFGIRGCLGDLIIEPKLVKEQFAGRRGTSKARCFFAGKALTITYHNPLKKDYGQYKIKKVSCEGLPFDNMSSRIVIKKKDLLASKKKELKITLLLV